MTISLASSLRRKKVGGHAPPEGGSASNYSSRTDLSPKAQSPFGLEVHADRMTSSQLCAIDLSLAYRVSEENKNGPVH